MQETDIAVNSAKSRPRLRRICTVLQKAPILETYNFCLVSRVILRSGATKNLLSTLEENSQEILRCAQDDMTKKGY